MRARGGEGKKEEEGKRRIHPVWEVDIIATFARVES